MKGFWVTATNKVFLLCKVYLDDFQKLFLQKITKTISTLLDCGNQFMFLPTEPTSRS